MIRLPALITEYARLDGRPRSTIAWYARLAREAGELPTTKRGRGAAQMGVREAVNLVLACNCNEDPKEGARYLDLFRRMKANRNFEYEDIEDQRIQEIAKISRLGDALEEFIKLTPYMYHEFDRIIDERETGLSFSQRFFIIKSLPCLELSPMGAKLMISPKFIYRRSIYEGDSGYIVEYQVPIEFDGDELEATRYTVSTNFLRERTISLRFGVFIGLASLFFEDSMQLPADLLEEILGGPGPGVESVPYYV